MTEIIAPGTNINNVGHRIAAYRSPTVSLPTI